MLCTYTMYHIPVCVRKSVDHISKLHYSMLATTQICSLSALSTAGCMDMLKTRSVGVFHWAVKQCNTGMWLVTLGMYAQWNVSYLNVLRLNHVRNSEYSLSLNFHQYMFITLTLSGFSHIHLLQLGSNYTCNIQGYVRFTCFVEKC